MAWIRTAASLISFGFTIYKFFQLLYAEEPARITQRVFGPRQFALLLIALGLVSLVVATVEQRRNLQRLRAQYACAIPSSLATAVAALLAIFGILAMVAVLLHY